MTVYEAHAALICALGHHEGVIVTEGLKQFRYWVSRDRYLADLAART